MITDYLIKETIKETIVSPSLKIDIVKRYLFDKTKEDINIILPVGIASIKASMRIGFMITDADLLEYFYYCSVKYYKEKFKDD